MSRSRSPVSGARSRRPAGEARLSRAINTQPCCMTRLAGGERLLSLGTKSEPGRLPAPLVELRSGVRASGMTCAGDAAGARAAVAFRLAWRDSAGAPDLAAVLAGTSSKCGQDLPDGHAYSLQAANISFR